MTTVTLDLPPEIYERALRKAQTSDRSVEQIIVDWIQPPAGESVASRASDIDARLSDLERFTNDELVRIATARPPSADFERLQFLLAEQQQRTLAEDERREAEQLVMLEDLQTLRKAKALFLLKQRHALPDDLLDTSRR